MKQVNTVLGTISPQQLGGVLMHEHIFCSRFDRDFRVLDRRALARRGQILLQAAKEHGISTILDATPWDLHRDIPLMQEISRLSGVQIIACAGTDHFYRPEIDHFTAEAIAGKILDAFDHGFGDTGVRPGAIKCAVQDEITPYHEKLLRATAMAHRATGLPVITHSSQKTALAQQDILLGEGVRPEMLIIGHTGDYCDLPLQTKLLSRGTYLGMDRTFQPEQRAHVLAELCGMGYAGQLMLGHDRAVYMDFSRPKASASEVWNQQNDADTPQGRRLFLFLHDEILPKAQKEGVSQQAIDEMLRENPRRYFAGLPLNAR